jgi:MFS superfamily sulfate permease-like transporter
MSFLEELPMLELFRYYKDDFPASIVVFFIALPLCLGIALASGAPLFSGIVSGIIGGIVVGSLSKSALGVSGPAAGLIAIVLTSLAILGNDWHAFLLAVFIAGLLQVVAGLLGGGVIAYYFPSSVIKGMLAGIGLMIIVKQIPFAFGLNMKPEEEMMFESTNHVFLPFLAGLEQLNVSAVLITLISLAILIVWDLPQLKRYKFFHLLQGPTVAVLVSILMVWASQNGLFSLSLHSGQLVTIPIFNSFYEFVSSYQMADFSYLTNINIYKIAITIAIVASLETLLCVEATDRLDPDKRITPTDLELKVQGIANMICGLVGGLPITQVIVRSSANITFGAKSKLSTILHGLLILLCVTTIPAILNMIPLATLAAILIVVGYKLTKPALYVSMYKLGWEQFMPFLATIAGIVIWDLLVGIGIGMSIAIFVILRHHYKNSHEIFKYEVDKKMKIHLNLAEEVSFLNKGSIIHELNEIPKNSEVIIDASKSKVIDHDVLETIEDFLMNAKFKNIKVEIKDKKHALSLSSPG